MKPQGDAFVAWRFLVSERISKGWALTGCRAVAITVATGGGQRRVPPVEAMLKVHLVLTLVLRIAQSCIFFNVNFSILE